MQGHGEQVPSRTVSEGGKVVKPEDPEADNYTFVAWYKDTEWKNAWDLDYDIVISDATLFAKWDEIQKTIGDILPDDFPEFKEDGWLNENNVERFCYSFVDAPGNERLTFVATTVKPLPVAVPLSWPLTKQNLRMVEVIIVNMMFSTSHLI